MKFFDTNVLVAASVAHHTHHAQSFARLAQLRQDGGACSAHTLAEAFNTLTRPSAYGLPPLVAIKIVEQASLDFTLVALTGEEALQTLQDAAQKLLTDPIIYDALLIACARKIDADAIYTANVKHFRQIAPDLASRIHEP